jgi:hypothetical protein
MLLMELNRPADAREQFLQTLKSTSGRPKAIYGLAQAAQASGDRHIAEQRFRQFLLLWKNADPDRPESAKATEFLTKRQPSEEQMTRVNSDRCA